MWRYYTAATLFFIGPVNFGGLFYAEGIQEERIRIKVDQNLVHIRWIE